MTPSEILAEDTRREALRREQEQAYDPLTGSGSAIPRRPTPLPAALKDVDGCPTPFLPLTMLADPEWRPDGLTAAAYRRLRFRHDFEYWAYLCVTIRDKESGRTIPLRLNRPQRRFVALLEGMRAAREPIRVIMLKARQWGGSLLYIYSYIYNILKCRALRQN